MILSPCKNCPNLQMPKDLCLEHCEKIQMLQEMQLSMPLQVYSAVDSADSNRYRISISVSVPVCE